MHAHSTSSPVGDADYHIFIDGVQSGTYSWKAPGGSGYDYNVLYYANSSLPYTSHSLTLQNGKVGGHVSLCMFDYFILKCSKLNSLDQQGLVKRNC